MVPYILSSIVWYCFRLFVAVVSFVVDLPRPRTICVFWGWALPLSAVAMSTGKVIAKVPDDQLFDKKELR